MDKIREISARYGPVAWFIAVLGLAYLAVLIFALVMGAKTNASLTLLSLPSEIGAFLERPWSLITHPFLHFPQQILPTLVDMAMIYSLGTLLQREVGRRRFQLAAGLFALASVVAVLALGWLLPVRFLSLPVNGFQPVVAGILASCLVMLPRLPVRILSAQFEFRWVALVILGLMLLGSRAFFTPPGLALCGGIVAGLVYGKFAARLGVRDTWEQKVRRSATAAIAKDRVRVKEARPSGTTPEHKGKFTVVHSNSKLPPEEELNRLLDRINEVGYNGLTVSEKRRLEELSDL